MSTCQIQRQGWHKSKRAFGELKGVRIRSISWNCKFSCNRVGKALEKPHNVKEKRQKYCNKRKPEEMNASSKQMLSFGLKWVNIDEPREQDQIWIKTHSTCLSFPLAPISLQRESNPHLDVIHILGAHHFPCLGEQNLCAVQTWRGHLHRRDHPYTLSAALPARADKCTARG